MYVSVEQVKVGIANFVEYEIANKAVGFQKFMTYFAIPIIVKNVEGYAKSFSSNPVAVGFFDEHGNVKLDELYNMAKASVKKSGQFTIYGVIFGETDIDKLYNHIRNATA